MKIHVKVKECHRQCKVAHKGLLASISHASLPLDATAVTADTLTPLTLVNALTNT